MKKRTTVLAMNHLILVTTTIVIANVLIVGGLSFVTIQKASARIVVGGNGDTIIASNMYNN
jgi:hypothetical protein